MSAELPRQWAAPKPTGDPVNYPAHYQSHPSGVECIQAIWYIDREIQKREKS